LGYTFQGHEFLNDLLILVSHKSEKQGDAGVLEYLEGTFWQRQTKHEAVIAMALVNDAVDYTVC
jgi:hypothetical protein